jgi:hypothetical protein
VGCELFGQDMLRATTTTTTTTTTEVNLHGVDKQKGRKKVEKKL